MREEGNKVDSSARNPIGNSIHFQPSRPSLNGLVLQLTCKRPVPLTSVLAVPTINDNTHFSTFPCIPRSMTLLNAVETAQMVSSPSSWEPATQVRYYHKILVRQTTKRYISQDHVDLSLRASQINQEYAVYIMIATSFSVFSGRFPQTTL